MNIDCGTCGGPLLHINDVCPICLPNGMPEPVAATRGLPISDHELLRRAVKAALKRTARKGQKHPRWAAVMDAFLLGSTYAAELCRRFDLDPDEEVSR